MKLNRFQAFAVHLSGSLGIAFCATALVFLVWYPGSFSGATGVTAIFLMMLGIDVVLGPCITLVVFNPAKKELKRDLLIVLIVQLAALFYGLHTVFIARPVYAVFNADRFDLVYANDLTDEKLSKVMDQRFKALPLFGPQVIAAKRPDSAKERSDLMFSAALGGDDVPQMPQYYVPYVDQRAQVLSRMLPLDGLRALNQKDGRKIDALLLKYGKEIAYLPLRGKVQDLTVIVARKTGEVLEINELAPW